MDEVYKQIVNIAKKYNTKKVVLFGSRARGTNHPKSDIDLAIYGCEVLVICRIVLMRSCGLY